MKSRDLGLLAVMAGLGYVAVTVLPPGDHAGELWPTGLAAGLLLRTGRARRVETALLVLLAVTAGALVVVELLTRGGTRTPRLRDNRDLADSPR